MALKIMREAVAAHYAKFIFISLGFFVLYYVVLLLATMLRFGEIPNYIEVYNIFEIYQLIFQGTPSLTDAIPIMLEEAWIETGYKNPLYYGVATWSYMLIPPKMLLVLFMSMLLGLFIVLSLYKKNYACLHPSKTADIKRSGKGLYLMAGIGSSMVALTSATLTWVVCCATPSWVVALAMLGMSASLALWLEPIGSILTVGGMALLVVIVILQVKATEEVKQLGVKS